MTDWTSEEDEAFNMVEKNSNLGKQILRANKSSGMDCCTMTVFKAVIVLSEPKP